MIRNPPPHPPAGGHPAPTQRRLGLLGFGAALAGAGPRRSPALPEVPTVAEPGVAGHEMVA